MTQEQIARRVGKSRASVANALRLLALPTEIRQLVLSGDLSAGHAKIISGIDIEQEQLLFAQLAAREGLSVRELERRVKKARRTPRKPRAVRYDVPSEHMKYISDRLHTYFGTSVRVSPSRTYANGKKGKGSIEIDFYSNEELDRILEVLGLTED
jgi:ParB family chromosome partitioning protein